MSNRTSPRRQHTGRGHARPLRRAELDHAPQQHAGEMSVAAASVREADGRDLFAALANFDRAHAACLAAGSCSAAGAACPGTSHTSAR